LPSPDLPTEGRSGFCGALPLGNSCGSPRSAFSEPCSETWSRAVLSKTLLRISTAVSPPLASGPSCHTLTATRGTFDLYSATTGALTPAGHSPTLGQVSLIRASGRLIILSLTCLRAPHRGRPPLGSRHRFLTLRLSVSVGFLTRVSPDFAFSPQARQLSDRIAFAILRTPPACLRVRTGRLLPSPLHARMQLQSVTGRRGRA
jgi:hypothetical protein